MVVVDFSDGFWRFGGIDMVQPFDGTEHHGVAFEENGFFVSVELLLQLDLLKRIYI